MLKDILFGHRFTPYQYVKYMPATNPVLVTAPVSSTTARWIGYSSLTFAFVAIFLLSTPILLAESIAVLQRAQNQLNAFAFTTQTPRPSPTPVPTPKSTPAPTPDPATLPFTITIPKITLQATVIPNVDASDPEIYKAALKKGVAHALGSGFPGQGKMVYIFGHSTDYIWNVEVYNALFYQVKDLEPGDTVILTLGDKETTYKVTSKTVVDSTDLSVVEANQNRNVLILQTCYPPGTTWKRLLVIAEPV